EEISQFCDAIKMGEEPRATAWSQAFLLRMGDDKKPAPGLPPLSAKWKRLLKGVDPVRGSLKPGWDYLERLEEAAKKALAIGETKSASKYASELLKRNKDTVAWYHGNYVHSMNQVLGLAALREGRTQDAKTYLLDAGKTPGSPQLNTAGPTMLLAQELLKQ